MPHQTHTCCIAERTKRENTHRPRRTLYVDLKCGRVTTKKITFDALEAFLEIMCMSNHTHPGYKSVRRRTTGQCPNDVSYLILLSLLINYRRSLMTHTSPSDCPRRQRQQPPPRQRRIYMDFSFHHPRRSTTKYQHHHQSMSSLHNENNQHFLR